MKAVPLGRVFALWNKAFMGVIAFSFPIERSWWPPREESTGKLRSCFSPGESSYIRNAMTELTSTGIRPQKNDASDAAAICDAVTRSSMRFVGVRPLENPRSAAQRAA